MGAESWAAFALALVVALAVPGPDLVLVVHSATRGVREGASTAAGVVAGLMLHALLAAAGATTLLVSAPEVLTSVQLLGAGVLLWMGASMLRATHSTEPDEDRCGGRRLSAALRLALDGGMPGGVEPLDWLTRRLLPCGARVARRCATSGLPTRGRTPLRNGRRRSA